MRKPEFIVHVARRENTLNTMESIASLTSASSQATVSFFGAQLLSWTPTAGRPVIWQTSFIEGNTVSFEGPTDRLYHCDARVTLDDPEWQRHHRSCTRDHIELELEHILPLTLKQLYHRYHRPVFRVLLSQALPGLRFIANRSMRSPCGRFCPARHSRFEQ